MSNSRRPLGSNPIILSSAIRLFYSIVEKLTEEQKILLLELDDLEASEKIIKTSHYGRDHIEKK